MTRGASVDERPAIAALLRVNPNTRAALPDVTFLSSVSEGEGAVTVRKLLVNVQITSSLAPTVTVTMLPTTCSASALPVQSIPARLHPAGRVPSATVYCLAVVPTCRAALLAEMLTAVPPSTLNEKA